MPTDRGMDTTGMINFETRATQRKLAEIEKLLLLTEVWDMSQVVKIVQYPDVLDSNMATQFHREIEDVVKAGANIVLLDLKNLTSITSSGLMALVEAFKLIRSAGCNLFICSLNEQVRILFELTGLDRVFETFASLDEFNSRMLLKK